MKSIFRSPYKNEKVQKKPLLKQWYELVRLYFSLNYMPYEYYCFRFDDKAINDSKILEFLPYSWFLYNVNLSVSYGSWESLFSNKFLFNSYARQAGLKVPEDYGIYNMHYGHELTEMHSLCNAADLEWFFRKHLLKTVVIKDLCGIQGKNIFFASGIRYEGDLVSMIIDGKEYTTLDLAALMGRGEYLFQEELRNNEFVGSINPNSLNTFRTITYLSKTNEVRILGTFLRTGIGKNKVDNWHAEGILIPIDSEKGHFIDYGYDLMYVLYDKHPDTGFSFRESQIPLWNELIEFVRKGAAAFPMMRFIAWDLAMTDRGIVVVEANIREINIFVNQLSNRGLAGILRDDLKELGYEFPKDKVPSVTFRNISDRITRIIKNSLHLGY